MLKLKHNCVRRCIHCRVTLSLRQKFTVRLEGFLQGKGVVEACNQSPSSASSGQNMTLGLSISALPDMCAPRICSCNRHINVYMMSGLTRKLGDNLDANVKQLFAGRGASMCAGASWLSFLRHDS